MATVLRSQCAFARLFAGKTAQILNNATDLGTKLAPASQSVLLSRKYSSYGSSPLVEKIKKEKYDLEMVKKPAEWAFVERLLPFNTIPEVKPKESYPSGWIPPREEARSLPYFIPRNKYHDLPVFLNITYRGTRKITKVKRIEGDIWLLNEELKHHLKKVNKMYIETRVQEVGRFIEVKGDYLNDVLDWAHSKGF